MYTRMENYSRMVNRKIGADFKQEQNELSKGRFKGRTYEEGYEPSYCLRNRILLCRCCILRTLHSLICLGLAAFVSNSVC